MDNETLTVVTPSIKARFNRKALIVTAAAVGVIIAGGLIVKSKSSEVVEDLEVGTTDV
jgi:hypothetical protein